MRYKSQLEKEEIKIVEKFSDPLSEQVLQGIKDHYTRDAVHARFKELQLQTKDRQKVIELMQKELAENSSSWLQVATKNSEQFIAGLRVALSDRNKAKDKEPREKRRKNETE